MFQTRDLPDIIDNNFGPMFAEADAWIMGLIAVVSPDLICYEAPLHVLATKRDGRRAIKTTHDVVRQQFGLSAIVECCAARASIECAEVNAQDVKKYFTGSPYAAKQDMINRCYQFRWNVRNDNEADACAIWSMAKSMRDQKFAPQLTPLFRSAAQ